MGCCGNGNKTGLTATISRLEVVYNSGEEEKTETIIWENIPAKTLKVFSSNLGDELAENTKNIKRVIKVGVKDNVKIGDLVELNQKDLNLGKFRIEDLDPQISRGRNKGIYLYLKKYNES